MEIEKVRSLLVSSVWQAFAQSGVDLTAVPSDQQQKLVAKIADTVMLTVDAIMEEETKAVAVEKPEEPEVDEAGETVLWKGRPFLSLVESYIVTSERLKIVSGLLSRKVENFELIRFQDIDFKQNLSERMIGIGDVSIRGQDPSSPQITLRNIAKPEEVYEILRRAWLELRKRHGLQFREYM